MGDVSLQDGNLHNLHLLMFESKVTKSSQVAPAAPESSLPPNLVLIFFFEHWNVVLKMFDFQGSFLICNIHIYIYAFTLASVYIYILLHMYIYIYIYQSPHRHTHV